MNTQHTDSTWSPWSQDVRRGEKEKAIAKADIKVFSCPPNYVCLTIEK